MTMTAFENETIRPLISYDMLKLYVRYIDDKLVLAKPSDIRTIIQKLNSFHSQIKFTHEEFTDNNDIRFLDIKITSTGTTINRKSTCRLIRPLIQLHSLVHENCLAQSTCLSCAQNMLHQCFTLQSTTKHCQNCILEWFSSSHGQQINQHIHANYER